MNLHTKVLVTLHFIMVLLAFIFNNTEYQILANVFILLKVIPGWSYYKELRKRKTRELVLQTQIDH
ncbi:hypothetical protein BKP37_16190 [Anaerobacillus alkalilacustris]|uniref:Uncharacterized protein n=1 Tax=Anaerobacillus alkalilacustris TaxID=393763 RepID=A0A1S2LGI5_9BACI|nr:hypothetical protein [Anaerobacillus alkalilacustris]OIJ11193.1 hypothetical protein BKP37_16190 [Anaerobacillus alkalilacustris]